MNERRGHQLEDGHHQAVGLGSAAVNVLTLNCGLATTSDELEMR